MLNTEKTVLENIMKVSGPIEILSEMSNILSKLSQESKSGKETRAVGKMRELLDQTAFKLLSTLENPRTNINKQTIYSESFYKKAK